MSEEKDNPPAASTLIVHDLKPHEYEVALHCPACPNWMTMHDMLL